MNKMKKIYQFTSILVVVLFSIIPQISDAQISTTLYHMYGVPQANQLNPAFQPHCNGYLGFPMLSPLSFSVDSDPLKYDDIFSYNSELDQMITFMHREGDKEAFINTLEPYNTLSSSVGSGPLSLGWRKNQFYFTIDFKERIELNSAFTKDMAEFILNGNLNQERFNFSGTGVDVNYFHEFSIGMSYDYEDQFQVGGRVKFLFGTANVNTRLSDITLRAYEDRWDFNSNIMLDVTGPELIIPVDSAGFVIWDEIDAEIDPENENYVGYVLDNMSTFLGIGNPGFGIDLGFNFYPIEDLSVSASVNDLAFIRWRNNAYQLEQDGAFTWEGVEVTLEEDWDPGEDLLDSLETQMKFTSFNEPYTTFLSGKAYMGVAYEINDKVKFGVVDRVRIYNRNFYNQLTLSANVMPIQLFSASLSYSIIGTNYMNFGLGLSLLLGPFNIYFITDQAPSGYLFPDEINSVNFRFGLNLVFGCAQLPKKLKDRPIID
jgi:hypothetical protein